MSKTAKTKSFFLALFNAARTVYAHITAKLNYAFDIVNSSLRFTPPPPPIKFRANPLAERVYGYKSVLFSDFFNIINQFFITFSRKVFFTIIHSFYIFARQNCFVNITQTASLR
ncbi:MAG: hypothetical protein LBH98_02125 [Chitinispirillales bacterium]|nr:hypothetical protein [Chitinispirillales bacterium]